MQSRGVVAVTGAAAGLGAQLVERLAERPDAGRVVGLDTVRGHLPQVTWRIADVQDPSLVRKLAGIEALAHLALDMSPDTPAAQRRERNVRGVETVLTAAHAAGVRRVVLLTSATVYGALPDNPVPLTEASPLRATSDRGLVGDWLAIERLARRARRTDRGMVTTVVRPAALVGPGVDTAFTRQFAAPRLLMVKGSRPLWQFCHVDDLVEALILATLGAVTGDVTVGCDGWLEQGDVERISGLRRIVLPAAVALAAAERLHRLGVTPAPASELGFLTHPWVVSCDRLRAAGWTPAHDNESALTDQLAGMEAAGGRRIDKREAARAAAGATVALAGAVAMARARAARRRRHT
ncbi:MAG TPA: NAD-dependent epimerase/dehydratase family protein [Mycobacteriales bacterium]|nr:NAD-dependent epimerase/dehydratase family protein [Mycobacteriales bacterium]